jgi:hypothetical protein
MGCLGQNVIYLAATDNMVRSEFSLSQRRQMRPSCGVAALGQHRRLMIDD